MLWIDHWDMIGLADDSPSGMKNQVIAGRYLTLVTSHGITIDTLKFTGISGMFYEYGGIAFSALTAEEKSAVEEILKIETIEEKSDDCTNQGNIQDEAVAEGTEKNESAGKVTSDAPVNENTYREVRDYSAELTDLQNRVSQVMMDKELPFVISSAILKNPDRLHVIVKTKDEDMIAKLKAFDTTGELLEIEYSESTPVKELLGSKGE